MRFVIKQCKSVNVVVAAARAGVTDRRPKFTNRREIINLLLLYVRYYTPVQRPRVFYACHAPLDLYIMRGACTYVYIIHIYISYARRGNWFFHHGHYTLGFRIPKTPRVEKNKQ